MDTSQTRFLDFKEIQRINKEILSQASIEEGRDIIAFIGPPSSGKTTLINCILRVPLIKNYDYGTEECTIVPEKTSKNIGDTQSLIPKEYEKFPGTTDPIVEFPGLGDFAGAELEIASALAYDDILRSQRTVSFVLVVPVCMIKSDNPMEFYTLLNNLVTLCPNLPGSFCIVGTKSDSISVTTCLQKALSLNFSTVYNKGAKIADVAKSAIKHILDTQNCIDFKAPDREPNISFSAPNIKEIVELIKNLQSNQCETHTPVILSEQSKTKIVDQLRVLESQLKDEIMNVTKYFELKLKKDDGTNKDKLEYMKGMLENITDFPSVLDVIQKSGFTDWSMGGKISEIINIQMLMNKFQIGGDMDKEDIADILNEVCNEINKVKDDQLENIEENTVDCCILKSKKPVTPTRKLFTVGDTTKISNDVRNEINQVQDDHTRNIEDNTVNSCGVPVTTTRIHSLQKDTAEIINDVHIEINQVQDDKHDNIKEKPVPTTRIHSQEDDTAEILNDINEINQVLADEHDNIKEKPVPTARTHSQEDDTAEILNDEINQVHGDQSKNIEGNTVNSWEKPVTLKKTHSLLEKDTAEISNDVRNEINQVQDDQPKNIAGNTVNSCENDDIEEKPVPTRSKLSPDEDTAEILNDEINQVHGDQFKNIEEKSDPTRKKLSPEEDAAEILNDEINQVHGDQSKNIGGNTVNSWEKPVTSIKTHSLLEKDTAEISNDVPNKINEVQNDQQKNMEEIPVITTRKHSPVGDTAEILNDGVEIVGDTAKFLNDGHIEINQVQDDQPKNIKEIPVPTTKIINDVCFEVNQVQNDQLKNIEHNTVNSCEKPVTSQKAHSQKEQNTCSNNCVFRKDLLELRNEVSLLSEKLQGIISWNT